jgi:hypothetical protein
MPVATRGFGSSVFDLEIRALTGTAEQTPATQEMVWVTVVSEEDGERDSLSEIKVSLSDSEGVNVVNDGDTVAAVLGSIKVAVPEVAVAAGLGSIKVAVPGVAVAAGIVDREHPVAASQLVVDVVTSTIRMVGSERGPPGSGAPEGGITVPADTSDAVGQYPSVSGSHRISVTAGVDPVSVAAGAK